MRGIEGFLVALSEFSIRQHRQRGGLATQGKRASKPREFVILGIDTDQLESVYLAKRLFT